MFEVPVMLQMKEKYANKKPYGKWLDAQVATLPDLVESVPEHLLKVPTIQSGHSPINAVPVASSSKGSAAEANGKANGSSNGSFSGSNGTLSSSQEGGQIGVNASNGHSKPGAGTHSCNTAFSTSHMVSARVIWFQSLLLIVVHETVLCAANLVAPSLHWQCCAEFSSHACNTSECGHSSLSVYQPVDSACVFPVTAGLMQCCKQPSQQCKTAQA